MTDTTKTRRFGLPYLDPSQSQPEVKINEAWDIIDRNLPSGSDVTSDSSDSHGGGSITVEERGSPHTVVDNVTTLRFVNATVESETGGVAVVTVEGGESSSLTVEDVDSPSKTQTNVSIIRFEGAIIEPASGGVVLVTIPEVQGPTGASGGQPPGAYWVTLGGGAITLPLNAVEKPINATGTIKRCIVYTKGGTGSCTIKIWKANITSHYPPISSDDITGGANVVISSGTTHDDSTLSGWTTSIAAGDILLFTLSATSTFTTIGISLLI
jgi:hypothetical protein